MSTAALERLNVHPDQLRRLLGAVDRLLAEAKPGWTKEQKEEAEKLALRWVERIRSRRKAREAARLQEQAGKDTFTPDEAAELFQEMEDETAALMADAAARVGAGEITAHQFYLDMERYITLHCRAAYIAGKVAFGGDAKLTGAEEKRIWAWREKQMRYLSQFYQAVKAGQLSPAQITARAKLYATALNAQYNQGQAGALGDIHLPQVPGDGKTRCRTNCKCTLRYEVTALPSGKVLVKVFWVLRPAEHCEDCVRLSKMEPFFQTEV